jgi:hypothetical protein
MKRFAAVLLAGLSVLLFTAALVPAFAGAATNTLWTRAVNPVIPGYNDYDGYPGGPPANTNATTQKMWSAMCGTVHCYVDPYSGQTEYMMPTDNTERVVASIPLPDVKVGEVIDAGYIWQWTNDLYDGNIPWPEALASTRLVVTSSELSTTGTPVTPWQGKYFSASYEHHQPQVGRTAWQATTAGDYYLNVVGKASLTQQVNCKVRPGGNVFADEVFYWLYHLNPGTPVPCRVTGELDKGSLQVIRHRPDPYTVIPQEKVWDDRNDGSFTTGGDPRRFTSVSSQAISGATAVSTDLSTQGAAVNSHDHPRLYPNTVYPHDALLSVPVTLPDDNTSIVIEANSAMPGSELKTNLNCALEFAGGLVLTKTPLEGWRTDTQIALNHWSGSNLSAAGMPAWTNQQVGSINFKDTTHEWPGTAYVTLYLTAGGPDGDHSLCDGDSIDPDYANASLLVTTHSPSPTPMTVSVARSPDRTTALNVTPNWTSLDTVNAQVCTGGFARFFGNELIGTPAGNPYLQRATIGGQSTGYNVYQSRAWHGAGGLWGPYYTPASSAWGFSPPNGGTYAGTIEGANLFGSGTIPSYFGSLSEISYCP